MTQTLTTSSFGRLFHYYLRSTPSNFLFQLSVEVDIDPDRTLAQRLEVLGNIAACSRQLSSGEKVGDIFPEPHSDMYLHIVVQDMPSGMSGD